MKLKSKFLDSPVINAVNPTNTYIDGPEIEIKFNRFWDGELFPNSWYADMGINTTNGDQILEQIKARYNCKTSNTGKAIVIQFDTDADEAEFIMSQDTFEITIHVDTLLFAK